jgi:hypothetical protein
VTDVARPVATPAPRPSPHAVVHDAGELARTMRRLQRLHDYGRLTAFTFTAVIDGDKRECGTFGEVGADEVVGG